VRQSTVLDHLSDVTCELRPVSGLLGLQLPYIGEDCRHRNVGFSFFDHSR
jgi:hypothetical protein